MSDTTDTTDTTDVPSDPPPPKPGMLGPEFRRAPEVDPHYAEGVRFTCSNCGSYPAADVNLRGHRGLVLWMEFQKEKGPFCRSCGLSEYRDMTSGTLAGGWWSPFSLVIAPYVLIGNFDAYTQIRALEEPVPGSPRSPMTVGAPVHRRPAILGLLVPLVVVAAIVLWAVAARSGGTSEDDMAKARAGHCVTNSGSALAPKMRFTDCVPQASPVFTVLARIEGSGEVAGCPQATTETFFSSRPSGVVEYVLCLAPLA